MENSFKGKKKKSSPGKGMEVSGISFVSILFSYISSIPFTLSAPSLSHCSAALPSLVTTGENHWFQFYP